MDVFQSINWLFNDQEPTLRQDGSSSRRNSARPYTVFAQSALAAATSAEGALTLFRLDSPEAELQGQRRRRITISVTQAGLSCPSISTVTRTWRRCPWVVGSRAVISTPPRRREPTGTGAGKRVRSAP